MDLLICAFQMQLSLDYRFSNIESEQSYWQEQTTSPIEHYTDLTLVGYRLLGSFWVPGDRGMDEIILPPTHTHHGMHRKYRVIPGQLMLKEIDVARFLLGLKGNNFHSIICNNTVEEDPHTL